MQLKHATILVIDDDPDILIAIRLLLKYQVKEIQVEKNPERIPTLLVKNKYDVIILDMNFKGIIHTGNEGLYWLKKIKEHAPETSVIVITAYGEIDLAIKSLKQGASDFIIKPWKNEKLIESITDLVKKRSKNKVMDWRPNIDGQKMIGESQIMKDLFYLVNKVAPTDANVLLLGENGTGKDLLAKAIHQQSKRKDGPFVKVDVGSLTESLFESELFGYKKGAFTGANTDRIGKFQIAHGGTLFLDEIGNISLHQQAKLLTIVQSRLVMPLGSTEQFPIDIRLICATNLPMEELANEERFRKDLIYRINTVELNLPPLRHREKDIVLLTEEFVNFFAEKYLKPHITMTTGFINKIKSHPFPGNIRELQFTIERAIIMNETSELTANDILFSPIEKFRDLLEENNLTLENVEKKTIIKVINKNKGNISKSAKELGITRAALYRRIEKYGI